MLRDLERTPILSLDGVVLSRKVQGRLRRAAARLSSVSPSVERKWRRRLGRVFGAGLDEPRLKALAAMNPGEWFQRLAKGGLTEYLENVEYHARRLAKLDVAPGAALASVGEYEKALKSQLKQEFTSDWESDESALSHLFFAVRLTLNNAYYQVRDLEATAFFAVLQDQLETLRVDDLLKRVLDTLTRTFRADAGAIVLRDGDSGKLEVKAWRGMSAKLARCFSSEKKCGLAADISSRGEPRVIVDAAAEEMVHSAEIRDSFRSLWGVPLSVGGKVTGVVQLAFEREYRCLPREMKLFEAIAERCALAIDKAQLLEELHEREERIRRLGEHMMKVEEEERRRISRELHDEVGQSLLVIRLYLETVQSNLRVDQPEIKAKVEAARTIAETTISEMRRLISALSPSVLADLGLAASIRQFVKNLGRTFPGEIELNMSDVEELPAGPKIMMYRLVQECFSNAVKHSNANNVQVDLMRNNGSVEMRMHDDGVGFDLAEALRKRESFGLAGMRERVALLGGDIHIQSGPGKGTKVSIAIPV